MNPQLVYVLGAAANVLAVSHVYAVVPPVVLAASASRQEVAVVLLASRCPAGGSFLRGLLWVGNPRTTRVIFRAGSPGARADDWPAGDGHPRGGWAAGG